MSTQVLAAFSLYLVILLTIGLCAHRKNTTAADFMVGNRSLNFWVTALSAHASDMSSWLFMGFPMAIFLGGMPKAWIGFGLVSGMFLNWHFVAPKLRVATERYGSYTLSDYFESRFGDKSGRLRIISAAMLLLFTTCYLAAGLTAIGFLLQSLFNMNYHLGICLATLVMLSYTTFGGFVAVAWTDFFQGCFLLVMILIVPAVALNHIGGWTAITTAAAAQGHSMSLLPEAGTRLSQFLEAFAWSIGYFGLPHVLTKFMGISSAKDMYKAKWLGISWQIITLCAASLVGLVSMAYFSGGIDNPELIFVEMVKQLFHPFFGGLILCGVLAATVSTMDSQVLVVSGVLAEDFYKKLWHKDANEAQLLYAGRVSVCLVSALALAIASSHTKTIYDIVFYAWSGLGSSFGPLVLVALYDKKASKEGAMAGLLCGGLLSAIWPLINNAAGWTIPTMIPGFGISLATMILVSRFWNKDTPEASLKTS